MRVRFSSFASQAKLAAKERASRLLDRTRPYPLPWTKRHLTSGQTQEILLCLAIEVRSWMISAGRFDVIQHLGGP